jgi:hypothetical protein
LQAKYGAGDFENANAVFIFRGNTSKAFLKTMMSFGYTTGLAQSAFEQRGFGFGRWLPRPLSIPGLNRLSPHLELKV